MLLELETDEGTVATPWSRVSALCKTDTGCTIVFENGHRHESTAPYELVLGRYCAAIGSDLDRLKNLEDRANAD